MGAKSSGTLLNWLLVVVAGIHSADEESADLTGHADVLSASASFDDASRPLLTLAGSPAQTEQVQTVLSAQDSLIESLRRLNVSVHSDTDAMSLYHADTQIAQVELTTSIQRLRGMAVAGLSDALERSKWSHTLLLAGLRQVKNPGVAWVFRW